ncbi:MAG: LysE family transporter [Syntrophomonadaceae bacterium]
MEIVLLFTTAFVVALSGAMMPGPMLSTAVAESLRGNWRVGPYMIMGHGILEAVLILSLAAGLAGFLTQPAVTTVIALAGGVILVLMGGSMSRDAVRSKLSLDMENSSARRPLRIHPALAGITVSMANPYWWLWWATIGLSYITLAITKGGSLGIVSFFGGHISADLAWYSLVTIAVSGGRRFLNPRVYQIILTLCGVFLVGMGFYFIHSGLTR